MQELRFDSCSAGSASTEAPVKLAPAATYNVAARLIKAGHDPKPPHASPGEVLCMRARLLARGTQLKPSLAGVFVRRTRRGEDAYPSAKKTPTKDCLMWHGDRLLLRAGRRLLSAVQPDPEWPGMWRVRLPDGDLSDMANRTRAKDAARARNSELC
jgi:hypothetical protein